jgi:replication factor A1
MLEFLKDPEGIRKAIVKQGKISGEELSKKLKQKQEEFYGLINEAAALYSIAKELGVEVEVEKGELQFTPIAKLSPEMQNVNLHARVMRVFAPRKFERNGKGGRVCNISIVDDSGEATLVLWHRDVELVEKGIIEKGDTVDVLGAYVKDSGEVHLPMGGQVVKVKERMKLPEVTNEIKKIKEMEEGMGSVDFVAEVLEVGAINSFERDGKMKQVSSLLVADGSGEARLSLWDGNAELVKRMRSGDRVKVESAYMRKGAFGKELHADWRSRVIINPRNANVPEVEVERLARVPIAELKEGMRAEVEGDMISASARSCDVCSKCNGLAYNGMCSKCGSNETERSLVVDALLKDGSGEISIMFFGRNAKDLLGVKEIPGDVDVRTILELKKEELFGRKIVARGNVRRENSNKLEFIVKRTI